MLPQRSWIRLARLGSLERPYYDSFILLSVDSRRRYRHLGYVVIGASEYSVPGLLYGVAD